MTQRLKVALRTKFGVENEIRSASLRRPRYEPYSHFLRRSEAPHSVYFGYIIPASLWHRQSGGHKIIPPRTTASSMRRRFGRSASMLRSRNNFYDRPLYIKPPHSASPNRQPPPQNSFFTAIQKRNSFKIKEFLKRLQMLRFSHKKRKKPPLSQTP